MFTIAIHPPLFCVAFLVVFIITFLVRIIKREHRIRLCYIGIIELYIMLLISVTIFPIRIIPSEMRTGKNSILDFCQLIPFKDIIDIVRSWKEAVIGLDRMVYNDARKEFSMSSMTGFGADGSQDEMKLDFEQVRGDFESNPFVTAVLEHIDDKNALGDELINRIGQLG